MSENKNQPVKQADNVVSLHAKTTKAELERLQRITGLPFDQLPGSLIKEAEGLQLATEEGEELIHRALDLWDQAETNNNSK